MSAPSSTSASPSAASSPSSWYTAPSSSDDSDYIETPVDAQATHAPSWHSYLGLYDEHLDKSPATYNASEWLELIKRYDAANGTSGDKRLDDGSEGHDMDELVHIAAGVYVPRYKLSPLPGSPLGYTKPLQPPRAPWDHEPEPVHLLSMIKLLPLMRPITPLPQDLVRDVPVFPGKLIVPSGKEGKDEWFPMYGSTRETATARPNERTRRAHVDAEGTLEGFRHSVSSSGQRARPDDTWPALEITGFAGPALHGAAYPALLDVDVLA
ncbi:unnamed protein product [Peniophora sp. CBMAI 1063]|nr:unnamed protein product [Peniophora sp. CBMAI 1063]